jgi:hypothetical protein
LTTPPSSGWTPLGRGSDGRFGLRRFRAKLSPTPFGTEIGIRMALRAHPHEVVQLVVKDGAKFSALLCRIRHSRQTCARLCHAAGGELEQIQFLLGHISIQTTERYLGCKQRIQSAVNDKIGIEPRAERAAHCPLCRPPGTRDIQARRLPSRTRCRSAEVARHPRKQSIKARVAVQMPQSRLPRQINQPRRAFRKRLLQYPPFQFRFRFREAEYPMHALAKGAARASALCHHFEYLFDAALRVDEGGGDVTSMTIDKETIRFLRCAF